MENVPQTVADWFHARVLRGRNELFSEVIMLTPDVARMLLASNEGNRRINQSTLEVYCADIRTGRWDLNGESIKVSTDGMLNDGQHRCWAVIETGMPIRTMITFGVKRDSRMTLDQGKTRSTADYIAMETGTKYVVLCSAIARTLLSHRLGGVSSPRDGLTRMAIRAEYWANEKEINAAAQWGGKYAPGMYMGGQVSALSALVLARRITPAADEFMQAFVTGADLDARSPILAARNKLMTTRGLKPIEKMRVILRALDAWVTDTSLTRIFVRGKRGLNPKRGK